MTKTRYWSSTLGIASYITFVPLFLVLLVTFPTMFPSKDRLLIRAVAHNDTNEVVDLIKRGANVNFVTGDVRKTPIMVSIATGHQGMAKLLLTLGADSDQKDANGKTAFDYAKEAGWTNWSEVVSNANFKPKQ